jgi:hypothetical protein
MMFRSSLRHPIERRGQQRLTRIAREHRSNRRMEQCLDDSAVVRFAPYVSEGSSCTTTPIGGGLEVMFAGPSSTERPELERFVMHAFERKHDAVVRTFMPILIGCRDRDRRLRSVVGLRAATSGPLYLERYLARSAEGLIAARTGQDARRESIVEVGNLAGRNCRGALCLVAALPGLLLALRFEWIVFTATRAVRGMLASLEAPVTELGLAAEACVAQGLDQWGRYYRNDPRVCAAWLPSARQIPAFASRMSRH